MTTLTTTPSRPRRLVRRRDQAGHALTASNRRAGDRRAVADLVRAVTREPLPFRVTAYDGTDLGPADAPIRFHLASPAGLRHLLGAPGDLGAARAHLTGQLLIDGVHPGDPYPAFALIKRQLQLRRPTPAELAGVVAGVVAGLGPSGLGLSDLRTPARPEQERPPRWLRPLQGWRGWDRSARAVNHHYDVSNAFYERVLGPSMTYTCAVYADPSDSLEQAQDRKYALVAGKLGLRPGMTLLDVGCGWGGMVRHAAREHGVRALGVTLSREQAQWAQQAIEREGLSHVAQVRHLDYRKLAPGRFDAISSIGLTEHVGARNYPGYFAFLRSRLRPGGRLLNHCITRVDGRSSVRPQAFTDRYVFPGGELAAPGRIIAAAHDAGLEVQHEENLRMHYAHTLTAWCANLVTHWDECVAEVGEVTARVWGLYLAGSRFAFETNGLQLHQVLATRPSADGSPGFPLRPDWDPQTH
ncbi:MAG TPA: class I SAM-dependent methyltransferase [Dermatophilaceae bacterium]|nr:class I SAM-dependent methyltransferase [Dermatophilaceae bacterium]